MTSKRIGRDRKGKHPGHDGNISRFLSRDHKRETIEVVDDESDVLEMPSDPYQFIDDDDPVQRFQTLRSGRMKTSRDENLLFQEYSNRTMTEEEEMEMALQQSKIEMEKDQKRRAMCGSLDDVVTRAVDKTAAKLVGKGESEERQQPTKKGISEVSKNKEAQTRAESPDLFGTPEDDDKFMDAKETLSDKDPESPTMVTGVFSTRHTMTESAPNRIDNGDSKSKLTELKKSLTTSAAEIKRPQEYFDRNSSSKRSRLSLKKTPKKASETSTFPASFFFEPDSDPLKGKKVIEKKSRQTEESSAQTIAKDRTATATNQDNGKTDDEHPTSPVIKIEQKKKPKLETSNESSKVPAQPADDANKHSMDGAENTSVVIDLSDRDEVLDEKHTSRKESAQHSTGKRKKMHVIRLSRKYKKPAVPITTIKDAINARLCRAPPGVNPDEYTRAIVRHLDNMRRKIREAQARCRTYVKWGKPVVPGPRDKEDSLDARVESRKRRPSIDASWTQTSPMPGTSEYRKRSLRSSNQTAASSKIPLSSANPTTRVTPKEFGFVDVESDDELSKPVFGSEAKPETKAVPLKKTETSDGFPDFDLFSDIQTKSDSDVKDKENNADVKHKILADKEGWPPKAENNLSGSSSKDKEAGIIGGDVEKKKGKSTDGEWLKRKAPVQKSLERTKKKSKKETKPLDLECEVIDSSDDIGKNVARKRKHRRIEEDSTDDENEKESPNKRPLNAHVTNTKPEQQKRKSIQESDDDSDIIAEPPEESVQENKTPDIEIKHERVAAEKRIVTEVSREKGEPPVPGSSLASAAGEASSQASDILLMNPPVRKRNETARKAAEAAERRHGMMGSQDGSQDVEVSSFQSEHVDVGFAPPDDDTVQCPMCFLNFSQTTIQGHAATCDGLEPGSSAGIYAPATSVSSPSSRKQSQMLRDLKVIVQRSPEAEQKLKEQRKKPLPTRRTKRIIFHGESQRSENDVTRDDAMSQSEDATGTRGHSGNQSDSRSFVDVPDDDSPAHSWLSDSSQKKRKYNITYGSKGQKRSKEKETSRLVDFIPLEQNDDHSDIESSDGNLSGLDSKTSTAAKPSTRSSAKKNLYKLDSSSDSESDSDAKIFATYGITVSPLKTASADASRPNSARPRRDVNSALMSRQRGKTSEGKAKPSGKRPRQNDFDDDDYANQLALDELSGRISKEGAAKAKKARATKRMRRARDSDSQESDNTELCFICNQRIPKEAYAQHCDCCLTVRNASTVTPGKYQSKRPGEKPGKTRLGGHNRSPGHPSEVPSTSTVTATSEDYITVDPNEIGDSPVKTFTLIGENSTNSGGIDFDKQFSFFSNKTPSSGRGRGRGNGKRGSRGKGRWSWKRRGRGKR